MVTAGCATAEGATVKRITAGEAIPEGALVACNEEGEAVNGEPVLVDPSGWESYSEADGTVVWRVTVTSRARRVMSARQMDALKLAAASIREAFTPDDPIGYER